MMKRGLCIALAALLAVSLAGCWSRKEPKTLALVDSALYDLDDNGGYQVILEVINPASEGTPKDGGTGKSPNITTISSGRSVPEAIRNASESLEKTIFGGHNKVRFFTERFARTDITFIIDYLLRDHLTDENPLMVVIRHDDPSKVYSCMIGLSETVGDYIDTLSESQPDETSNSVFIRTLDFVKDYYDEGKQPVTGLVQLVECAAKISNNTDTSSGNPQQGSQNQQDGSDKKYRIVYEGLAAFKGDRLVGYMDETEARAYNFITGNVGKALVSIPSKDGMAAVIVTSAKADIKTRIEDGRVVAHVTIRARMSLIQESGILDVTQMEPLKAIEAGFNKQMAEEITSAIQKAQTEFGSDIFGFGSAMHRQHPERWREIKEDWDGYFSMALISVSVESTIDRSGEIKQPFRLEGEQ